MFRVSTWPFPKLLRVQSFWKSISHLVIGNVKNEYNGLKWGRMFKPTLYSLPNIRFINKDDACANWMPKRVHTKDWILKEKNKQWKKFWRFWNTFSACVCARVFRSFYLQSKYGASKLKMFLCDFPQGPFFISLNDSKSKDGKFEISISSFFWVRKRRFFSLSILPSDQHTNPYIIRVYMCVLIIIIASARISNTKRIRMLPRSQAFALHSIFHGILLVQQKYEFFMPLFIVVVVAVVRYVNCSFITYVYLLLSSMIATRFYFFVHFRRCSDVHPIQKVSSVFLLVPFNSVYSFSHWNFTFDYYYRFGEYCRVGFVIW